MNRIINTYVGLEYKQLYSGVAQSTYLNIENIITSRFLDILYLGFRSTTSSIIIIIIFHFISIEIYLLVYVEK